jgi:gliding motility-associated-like protein
MKKITLLLFFLLSIFTVSGQVIDEDFEADTFQPVGWTMTTNGVGSSVNPWTRTTNTALTNGASVGAARAVRQTTAPGQERQTWLITPQVIIPTNGQLRFFTRNELAGNQGSTFSIRISTNADPTNLAAYTTVVTWTELDLVAQYDVYEEKVVSLLANVGNNAYIAFVRSNVQVLPGINGNGDNWLVDDVLLIEQCLNPTALTATSVLSTSAVLGWTVPNGATEWDIEYGPQGFTPGTGTVVTVTTNPFTLIGLTAATQYSYYVSSICSTINSSAQVGPTNFTTQVAPPVCGGQYFDPGGPTANYANNLNTTITICPDNPTDLVTVTFTSFQVENGWDALYVFQGSTASPATQISSGLGLGLGPNGALTGGFWSSVANALIPGPFVSAAPGGCLTFQFISDGSVQQAGWLANVTCAPAPTCPRPTAVTISDVTGDSATVAWTDNAGATTWEYLVLPCGSPEPNATTPGFQTTTTNPLLLSGLTSSTCNQVYVRAVCSPTDKSLWSTVTTFTTTQIPVALNYAENFEGVHGWTLNNGTQTNKWVVGTAVSNSPTTSLYVSNDSGVTNNYTNNAASVVHAYRDIQLPAIAGEINVSFDWRNVGETGFDYIRAWLVPASFVPTPGTQITAAASGGQQLGANFVGNANFTNVNFLITATPFQGQVRRIIFEWRNDGIIGTNPAGAIDNVNITLITCPRPTNLVASDLEPTSLSLGWTEIGTATEWQVLSVPCGSPVPANDATGWIQTSDNPYSFTGLDPSTCYTYYVRSFCGLNDVSLWSQPLIINTPQIPVQLAYEETFEAVHGWTLNNGTQTNKWVVGSAVSVSPTNSLYISNNNGVANTYTNNATSVVQAYRDIAVPANAVEVSIDFEWRNNGENNFDYIRVWSVPITYQPTPGVQTTIANSGGQQLGANFQLQPNFTSANFVVNSTAFAGTTRRLIFEWRNDGSGGIQPPAAIDNIKIDYALCLRPTNLVVSSVGTFSAEISWTNTGGATEWDVYWVPVGGDAPTNETPGTAVATTNPYLITGLSADTQYNIWVRSTCAPVGGGTASSSFWIGPISITTLPTCPQPIDLGTENDSGSSIDLVWTPLGVETQWEVVYQLENGPLPADGEIVNEPLLNVNDVADGGIYEFYVRAICGENDLSQWSGPFIFVIFNPESCASVEVFDLNLENPEEIFVCEESDGCVELTANYLQTGATTSYAVESIDYAPPFPFVGGTQTSVDIDDRWSDHIPLPFDFCFYGSVYTNALVGSNGVVHFGNDFAPNGNCPWSFATPIPNVNFPIKNAIFGVFQDIDPGISNIDNPLFNPNINYQVLGSFPCRALVVSFSDVAQFSGGCQNATVGSQTSQIVIYEVSNIVEIYIQRRVPCTSWQNGNGVVGLINSTGAAASVPPGRNTGAWSATNEAWRFTPNGESNVEFEWLLNGDFYSSDLDITVCIEEASVMTARATYTNCVGADFVSEADINISFVEEDLEVQDDVLTCAPYELLPLSIGNYFTLPDGEGEPLSAGDIISTTQTIYVYATFPATDGFCESQGSFEIVVDPLEAIEFDDVEVCGSFTLETLPENYQYFTGSGGTGTELFVGDIVSSTQEVYLYLTFPDGEACFGESSFIIDVTPSINLSPIADIFSCNEYVLPFITGENIVDNGSFEMGNSGFTSDYTYLAVNPAGGQGLYTVGTSSQTWFNAFGNCFDHTTGSGNMLMVDGSTTNGGMDRFWCQTISVVPNQDYVFSYWVQTIALPNVAMIETRINDIVVGSSSAPSTICGWEEHSYTWNSGDSTTAEICLFDLVTIADGNDFAIDDISFAMQSGLYYTEPGGMGTALTAGTIIDTTQELWVYMTDGPCTAELSFMVNIDSVTADILAPVSSCDSYVLPALSLNNSYYTGAGATGDLLVAGDTVVATQTLYIHALSPNNPLCTAETTFEVTINNTPVIPAIADVLVCDNYTLPVLSVGNYYTESGASGTLLTAGDVITSTQTLYVYADNNGCIGLEQSFTVTIPVVAADLLSDVTVCDRYELPALSAGNTYYTGTGGTGEMLTAGSFVTSTQTVYVYFVSATTPACTDENSFVVTINATPTIASISDVVACDSFVLPALPVGDYYTGSGATGTLLSAGFEVTTTQTIYVYANNNGCIAVEQSFMVTIPVVSVETLPDVEICDVYFLPELTQGNYYTSPGGTGIAYSGGDEITASQTLYIYQGVSGTECFAESSFEAVILACQIPRGISPNSDGFNDTLDLTNFDVRYLSIYNRHGREVYNKRDYTNEWFGQSSNGDELPDGTYFYNVERNNGDHTTGWIYINRER